MENNVPNEIVRGHINTIILSSLVEGDKYGYEIRKEIEAKTQGSFILKEPTLYSSLKRLEKQGFVEAYYGSEESSGGRRKYYKLTEYGRGVTLKNLNEWKYSRSLIDKLITEEKVDLHNTPPPETLGLNITKKVSKKYAEKSKEPNGQKPDNLEKETKFVYNTEYMEPPKKSRDPVIQSSKMFETADEDEKTAKEYKNLMDKLISTTKTHTFNFENVKAVEKVKTEENTKEENEKEKVSYSLLPKIEDTGFLKTQAKIQSEGFKIRNFNAEKSKGYKQLVLINKLLFWTLLLTFATMLLELVIVYFVFENKISLGSNPYLIIAACLTVLPLAGAVLCIINPDKKIKAKLNLNALIFYSLLIFAIGFLIILCIRLTTQPAFKNAVLKDIIIQVIFPALLLFNILTSTFLYALLYRSKKFHV